MTLLLVVLLQSTLLLSLGFLFLHLTRRHGPAVQTWVGRATLCAAALLLACLPLSGHIQPLVRVSEPTPRQVAALPVREGKELPPVGATLAAPSDQAGDIPAPSDRAVSLPAPAASVLPPDPNPAFQPDAPSNTPRPPAPGGQALALGGFLAVSAVLLLWLAVCQWHLTRLRRAARPVTGGPALSLLAELAPHPPRLLTHASVRSPFLAGYVRPAIFLPPTYAADFDADALRAIFVHELAHLGRRDNLWTLASRLLTALLWFQPLLWLLARKLEHISEDACDQAVLASNCPPRAYAACLLSLAGRPPLAPSRRTLTAGVAPFRSSVGRRISHILASGVTPMPPVTLRQRSFHRRPHRHCRPQRRVFNLVRPCPNPAEACACCHPRSAQVPC